ncbi:MAG: sulfide/dihydroorotate dehydrogenase-like FAD/NAD-binding protein, partial [Sedimentisphaerales bacterium]|nr:sulfide/dihydroorotate dehydrogenase-like FAD/NAD-binding protein [Sedimentisphaerales bacterium]
PDVTEYEILAPRIAKARKPCQFVILRPYDHSERIPLTVAETNPDAGTITLIVQTVGKTTLEMAQTPAEKGFLDVVGPLGHPSHIESFGRVVCIGGGLGAAVIYPQAVALRDAGNEVISIIGARTKDLILLEDHLRRVSDDVILTTDDGSAGRKGFVTDALKSLLDDPDHPVGAIYCAGPVIMMKAVAETTRPAKIPTIVSLNPIMVDGTGMCGGCRVTIDGQTKFACVDGPEFDGHHVDYDELMDRLTTYRNMEQRSRRQYEQHQCKLQKKIDSLS